MLRSIVLLVLLSCALGDGVAKEPSRFELLSNLAWHEARGEPLFVQQLILDTAINRARMCSCSLYKVLTAPQQYPWAANKTSWHLTREQAELGFRLLEDRNPVRSNFIYFNHVQHSFTKKNVRMGNLYFAVK